MIGSTVSHYKILEKLGQGGMGVVYKAHDTQLDRDVALKFFPPQFTANESDKARFLQEARAAAQINHPNVCDIHDIVDEDEQPFIVMEYVEGETIKDKIDCSVVTKHSDGKVQHISDMSNENASPLHTDDVINFTTQIAEGLQAAHDNGIIHRDVKSANIMVTPTGQIKIMDFGLAKLQGQIGLTKSNTTLGTVAYMSPEQARGEEVDHRTDIWSFGVVLYEMLTGELPFKGSYEQAVLYAIMNEDLNLGDLEKTNLNALIRTLKKALAKDPNNRYQNANEINNDLNYINSQFTRKFTTRFKSREFFSRTRFFIGMLLLSFAAILILVFLDSSHFFHRKQNINPQFQNSIAVLPFINVSQDSEKEWLCEGIPSRLGVSLTKLRQLKVTANRSAMKFKISKKSIPEIAAELNVNNILDGQVTKSGDQIRISVQLIAKDGFNVWTHDYNEKYNNILDLLDELSREIAHRLISGLDADEINKLNSIRPSNLDAYDYFLQGDYLHRKKYWGLFDDKSFRDAESMFLESIKADSNYIHAYTGIADLYDSHRRIAKLTDDEWEASKELIEKYLDKASKIDSLNPDVLRIKSLLSNNVALEFEYLKKAYKMNPNDRNAIYSLGIFYRHRGLYKHAIELYNKVLDRDPYDHMTYLVRGLAYIRLGQYALAENDYLRSLEIEPSHLMVQEYWPALLIFINKFEEAQEYMGLLEKKLPNSRHLQQYRILLDATSQPDDEKINNLWVYNKVFLYSHHHLKENAISLLAKVSKRRMENFEKYYYTPYLNYQNAPYYDFIRDDERFKRILFEEEARYKRVLELFYYSLSP